MGTDGEEMMVICETSSMEMPCVYGNTQPLSFSPLLKKYLRWMFFLLEQKMGILLSFFPADNVLISLSLYGTASTPCTTRRERKYTFVHGLSPLVELQTNNRHPIWSCLSKL